jgi:hypothetical protein
VDCRDYGAQDTSFLAQTLQNAQIINIEQRTAPNQWYPNLRYRSYGNIRQVAPQTQFTTSSSHDATMTNTAQRRCRRQPNVMGEQNRDTPLMDAGRFAPR